jgi:hypothetical protein
MSNHVNLGPEQAYQYFLTVAPSNLAEIVGFRSDAHLVQHNAQDAARDPAPWGIHIDGSSVS